MTYDALASIARDIRITTFRSIAHAGGGHFGGSLSIAEILAVLYFSEMTVYPEQPDDPRRDRFILSKGHAGPALYTALALRGYFPVEQLKLIDVPLSPYPKHVDRLKLKGIEASTGPLGQGLSIGCGMAISFKQQRLENRVYVLMGDGECDSGQGWEAAMACAKYKLDNLTLIIDRNKCQIDGFCDDIMPIEPLGSKYEAFGWYALQTDGHDVQAISEACSEARRTIGKPTVIIADTVKGRGVSFMEGQAIWHSGQVSEAQLAEGLAQLEEMSHG